MLGRVSGVLGFPAKREIGDCYVWGAWGDGEVSRVVLGACCDIKSIIAHYTELRHCMGS